MAVERQPDIEPAEEHPSIPSQSVDWLRQFVKHLKLHFFDSSGVDPNTDDPRTLQNRSLRAAILTLFDSGMSREDLVESLADISLQASGASDRLDP